LIKIVTQDNGLESNEAAVMSKSNYCERCPDEHTDQCNACNKDKLPVLEEITYDKAIAYFEEENERYENMLGSRAKLLEEYRINRLVIEILMQMN
jgi:flagellar motility protein MotE (MotC chaperone)